MSGILKALFGLGKLKVVPAHRMTVEILNKLSSQLGKLMFIVKSNKLKLTKKQSDYIMNQSKQIAEAEKRLFQEVPVKDAKVYKFPEGGVHNVPVAKQFTRPASDYPHLKGTKGHPDVIDIPKEEMLRGITGKEVTDPFKTGEIRWILNRANKEGLFAFKPEELKIIKGGKGDLAKIFKDYYGNKAFKNLPGEGSVTSASKYHKTLKNAVDEQGFSPDHPQFNKEKIIFPDDLAHGGRIGYQEGGGYKVGELKHAGLSNSRLQEIAIEFPDLAEEVARILAERGEDYASGGIAGQLHLNRPGYRGGKIVDLIVKHGPAFKKFADGLFIKASNAIRRGTGIFKNLTQEQKITQHDNLVKTIKTFERKGTLEGTEQYFGIEAEKAFITAQAKVKDRVATADKIKKGVADVMKDTSEAGLARSIEVDNLKLEFPGISDDMINNILTDTNPQRIAEVKQTMREALKMQEKMSADEIINTFKKTPRTLQASGGVAGQLHLNQGGRARFANGSRYKIGMWNPDKTLVSVGINPGTGTPEWMYPHDAAAMGIFPTMDYEGNKIATAQTPVAGDTSLLEKWGEHAQASQAMKGKTGLGTIPEYGMQTGYDFQKKFTGTDPRISSYLASLWQLPQETIRAVGKTAHSLGSNIATGDASLKGTWQDWDKNLQEAWKTANVQAGQNIEGIMAATPGGSGLTAEQQADRNKYLSSLGQKVENLQARNIDPRMAGTYKQNIQLMADPRMRGAKGGLARILGV